MLLSSELVETEEAPAGCDVAMVESDWKARNE